MTYAIVETSGTQLRVEAGRFYDINRLPLEVGDSVSLDCVLLIEHEGEVNVGRPLVEGATVEATVMEHRRGKKILVAKMRPKKKTRKKQGHRQELTRLNIESIRLHDRVLSSAAEVKAAAEAALEALRMQMLDPGAAIDVEAQTVATAIGSDEVEAQDAPALESETPEEVISDTESKSDAEPEAADADGEAIAQDAPDIEPETPEAVTASDVEPETNEAPAPESEVAESETAETEAEESKEEQSE